jgi:hypothetical protein
MNDDIPGDPKKEIQKLQRVARADRGWSWPSLVEAVLAVLTALAAVVWLAALFWVPDGISGQAWLFGGLFAGLFFGGPTLLVYVLRRGAIGAIERFVTGW